MTAAEFKVVFLSNGNFSGPAGNNVEQLWVYHLDPHLTYSAPFIQVTSLSAPQPATEGRIAWADWYSFDATGSNLVFTCNADLVGGNSGHAYEIFLASFVWHPFRCNTSKTATNQYWLSWPTGGYRSSTLETCTSLVNSIWLPMLPTSQSPAAVTSWTNNIDLDEPARFFRVRRD